MSRTALTEETMVVGLSYLASQDSDLAHLLEKHGPPPFWNRPPGFATLIHIILEQQVSLASAQAAFDRLCQAIYPVTPAALLTLDDANLRAIGFSRQKAGYARHLAQALLDGRLDMRTLDQMDDEEAQHALTELKGIGPWTAAIYLLMALRRPDVWPAGDLALAQSIQVIKQLPSRPDTATMEAISQPWRPWGAVAARLLWRHYLDGYE